MSNVQKYAKKEDRAGKVIFVITTDGYENASNYVADSAGTELNYKAMNKAISYCRIDGKIDRSWKEEVERDYKWRR
jgi:predicted Zn-dependent protease